MTDIAAISGENLSAAQVYEIWRIRDAVFAVEQQCDEPDVDGIDLEPTCTHLWLADAQGLTSYLRSFLTPGGLRKIGRVATRQDLRGRGLAGRLMTESVQRWGEHDLELGAQAHLHEWYAGFGFERCGPNFREAGIDHIPMRRPGRR